MLKSTKKILQIVPAVGWYALYRDDPEEGKINQYPLTVWALIHEEDTPYGVLEYVDGLCPVDGLLDAVSSDSNFIGFRHESDPPLAEKKEEGE